MLHSASDNDHCVRDVRPTHFPSLQDGGPRCGVHARTSAGKYITIIDSDPVSGAWTGETTGLAFSPDGRRMYVAFQKPGVLFEISRTDGYSFGGDFIDLKYHST